MSKLGKIGRVVFLLCFVAAGIGGAESAATIPSQRVSSFPKNFPRQKSPKGLILPRIRHSKEMKSLTFGQVQIHVENGTTSTTTPASPTARKIDNPERKSDLDFNPEEILNDISNPRNPQDLDGAETLFYGDIGMPTQMKPLDEYEYSNSPGPNSSPTTGVSYRPVGTVAPAPYYRPISMAPSLSYRPTSAPSPSLPYRPMTTATSFPFPPGPDLPITAAPSTPCPCPNTPSPDPITSRPIIRPTPEMVTFFPPVTATAPPEPITDDPFTSVPIITITNPTPTDDPTDLGTFPSFTDPTNAAEDEDDSDSGGGFPGQTSFPSSSGTIVPILGSTRNAGGGLQSSRSLVGGRSLFGSNKRGPAVGSNLPQRRVVAGDGIVGRTRSNSRELLRENKDLSEVRVRDGGDDQEVIKDFMFSDIKCYRTNAKEYFGAMVHMRSGFEMPYIRDRPEDPMTPSSDCRMESTDSPNSYHMKISDLRSCGVEQCGDQNMCLTMVFPRVAKLSLADDEVTTINCTPQRRTMSETRTISFAGDSLEGRRSSSTVEGGGQDFAAEVGIFRENTGTKNGLFVKRVNQGGVVQLGEPLQLRSVVRGGDGWTASKLTDVKVWRMRNSFSANAERMNPNDASEVITLVDPNGCRNEEFKVISDAHPLRDPRNDLVHHFNFKAFLFRGQRASEPLVVTAKVQACQDQQDCLTTNCNDGDAGRFKRAVSLDNNPNSTIHDWSSHMSLRVVGPKDRPSSILEEKFHPATDGREESRKWHASSYSCRDKMALSSIASSSITMLLCILIFTAITICYRRRFNPARLRHKQEFQPPQKFETISSSEDSNFILRRNHSLHASRHSRASGKNNPNSRTLNSINANKPLPPTPSEKSGKESEKKCNSDKSNGSQQRRNSSQYEPAEYEVIPDEEDDNNNNKISKSSRKNDEGFYMVYYPNRESKKRSRSVPAGGRDPNLKKVKALQKLLDTTETSEDSSCSYSLAESKFNRRNERERRTVRNTKRNQQKHRTTGQKLDVLGSVRHGGQGGSFPTRIIGKRIGGGTRSCRERKRVNFSDGYLRNEISTQLSSEDSAYSGSISSKITTTTTKSKSGKGKPSFQNLIKYADKKESSIQNSEEFLRGADNTKNLTGTTHFVSRNDTSTQIFIIPETNV